MRQRICLSHARTARLKHVVVSAEAMVTGRGASGGNAVPEASQGLCDKVTVCSIVELPS